MTDNDLTNRELSIEELEAIAAGNWLGDAFRWVKHEAVAFANHAESYAKSFVKEALQPWRIGKYL